MADAANMIVVMSAYLWSDYDQSW